MPSRASDHLRLVADLPQAAPPRARSGTRLPACAGSAAALAVLLALLGGQRWELPARDGAGVAAVPQSVLTFLLVCAGLCLWTAGRAARPAEVLRSAGAVRVWWAVTLAAALVGAAADVSLASYAAVGWPGGLVARWAVPFTAAVLAGLLGASRAARIRLALGTGVVSVPLVAAGWALLASPAGSPAGPADVVAMTLVCGVTPLAFSVAALTAGRRPG